MPVAKQTRSRRQPDTKPSPATGSLRRVDRRVLGVGAGLVSLAVVGLAIAAITFAAFTKGPGSPPSGTDVFPENDHSHVLGTVTYDRNPPAGGPHNSIQLNCGVYRTQVPNENAVHSLEHGAVWITYQPSLPAADVASLRQIAVSNYVGSQRYVILSPYPGLPAPIVASAWGAQLRLESASDDRLLEFLHYYAGGAQGGEQGAECTGGVGTPIE
jgi:hypothetical protein